ncbi:hypothetical protein Pelo_17034 [Pelomyxa schiedti]|nr:hypothetical protein Pelo_17034 [Pelomyxa schiedti]
MLQGMHSLETLDLPRSVVGDFTLKSIARSCPLLKRLTLTVQCTSGAIAEMVTSCPQLIALSLTHSVTPAESPKGIDDAALAHIGRHCTSLNVLSLTHTSIGNTGAMALASSHMLRKLAYLQLCDCPDLDDACAAFLVSNCTFLRGLGLQSTAVGNATALAIGQKCSNLETLLLGNTRVSDPGVEALLQRGTFKKQVYIELPSSPTISPAVLNKFKDPKLLGAIWCCKLPPKQ